MTTRSHRPKAIDARLRPLFDEHHDFLWRSVRKLGVWGADVDDVVQETFIIAGRKLDEFEGRSSVRTWLFAIALRVAHTHRRSRARRERKAQAHAEVAPVVEDPYARAEAADVVQDLLERLDEPLRTAFVCADLEGKTAREIADELRVNPNTVASRVRSARRQIVDALAQIEGDESPPHQSKRRNWAAIAGGLGLSTKSKVVAVVVLAAVGIGVGTVDRKPPSTTQGAYTAVAPARARTEVEPPARLAASDDDTLEVVTPVRDEEKPKASRRPAEVRRRPAAPGLAQEMALIERLDAAATSGDHALVLRLAREHARTFGTGQFGAERMSLEAAASCSLGRVREGRALLDEIARRWPRAPDNQRALSACKGGNE